MPGSDRSIVLLSAKLSACEVFGVAAFAFLPTPLFWVTLLLSGVAIYWERIIRQQLQQAIQKQLEDIGPLTERQRRRLFIVRSTPTVAFAVLLLVAIVIIQTASAWVIAGFMWLISISFVVVNYYSICHDRRVL